jgi:exonuclease SbcC
MIPVKLTLDGFLSYREKIDLDFSEFELACVIGHNGAGKSSLLDAITWALFGKARSSDDELVNLDKEAAFVWLEFYYEDLLYRIERSKKRGGTKEVVLNVWNSEDQIWVDFSEGTNTDTQAKIERILRMDYETFINASFFLQGKADQFAQQRPGDRKKTLAKILELDIWEMYRREVADKRRLLERDLDLQNARIKDIDDALAREPALIEELNNLQAHLVQTEELVHMQEKLVEGLRKAQQQIENQREQVELLSQSCQRAQNRVESAHKALDETEDKRSHYQALLDQEEQVKANYETWQHQQNALDAMDALAQSFNEIHQKREQPLQQLLIEESRMQSEYQHLTQMAKEIGAKEQDLSELKEKLVEARHEQEQIREETSRYVELEEKFDDYNDQTRILEPDLYAIRMELQRLKDRKVKLENLDAVECPTCGQPLTEIHRQEILSELKEHHTALRDEYENKNSQLDVLQEKMATLKVEIQQLKEKEERELVKRVNVMISSYEVKIQAWAEDVLAWEAQGKIRLHEVETALKDETFCVEERKILHKLDKQLRQMGYDPEKHEILRSAVQEGRKFQHDFQALSEAKSVLAELSKVYETQQSALTAAQDELDSTIDGQQKAQEILLDLEKNSGDYTAETRKLMQLRDDHNLTRQSVGGAEQRLNALKERRSIKKTLLQEREKLTADIGQHRILEEAFGKDGVPALLIEQALPEIEDQANKILERLSTTGMNVQLRTQAEYKDRKRKDMKETLDIIISDDVGIRSYEMYSGGEAFRVNFAIRLALSRMLASRTGARLQTLVIDEGFGSQDADGVQRLVSTINAIKDDFAKVIVITHLEALKGVFPTQIEITKTALGSQLQVAHA